MTIVQRQILADERRHHYQFVWVRWNKKDHIHFVDAHMDIIDGKIWIQKDGTEVGFANLLVKKGISKSDIVLAYFSPSHRELTEFSVA